MQRIALGLILLVSLLVRVGYLVEVQDTWLARTEAWGETDMHFFWQWAERIASGDLLTDGVFHPFHAWHGLVGTEEEWSRWYGGKTWHQAPLYPYLIALVSFGATTGKLGLWVLQIGLGLLSVVGVYRIGTRCFDRPTGLVAAAVLGLSSGVVFHESLVLRASLLLALHVLVMWVGVGVLLNERGGWRGAAVLGLAVGLLTLTRANGLLLVPVLLLFAGKREAGRWSRPVAFLVAFFLALAPSVTRNLVVGAPLLSLSAVGPVTFTMGSAADVSGLRLELSKDTRAILEESHGEILGAFVGTLKTHADDPLGLVEQQGRKLLAFFHGFEAPDNGNVTLAKVFSVSLKYGTIPFGWISPLALVGLLGLISRVRRKAESGARAFLVFGGLTLGVLLLTALVFYPSSRFRVPLLSVSSVFTALCVVGFFRSVRERRWGALGVPVGLAAGLLVLLNFPFSFTGEKIRRDDVRAVWIDAKEVGQPDRGLETLNGIGEAFPDHADVLAARVEALVEAERHEEVEPLARRLERLEPQDPLSYVALAWSAARRGKDEEALEILQRGVTSARPDAGLHRMLARMYREAGNEASARGHEAEARRIEGRLAR